ncbi:reticulon-like protein B23 isoform X1 [Hevea brasiliensis]|uniref:reticulon-like protein B23 isoform X1 n=1 Tax=Hevea brasiliensis TaxID=3981 RepID=UPI0025CC04EA|nr:reticulon-like protein B23 isoform X1 [Hevea brasiliensis]
MESNTNNNKRSEIGKPMVGLICGTLVYYHCAYRNASLLSLVSDVLIVLLCSLAILGLLFRQMNISVPVDPLEWQISQDTANSIVAWFANTIGAAESVLRVAATGHDKRLFFKVAICLYILSALGRLVSGFTVAYAGQLDLSTLIYGQMTKHCSFGHFAQADCRSPGLGQAFGPLSLVWFYWHGFFTKVVPLCV